LDDRRIWHALTLATSSVADTALTDLISTTLDDHAPLAVEDLTALPIDLTFAVEDVPDEDWAARSQRELTAIEAGTFIVAPPWDLPAGATKTVIVIEPSRGFGTGHHASTRLCLRALSECTLDGDVLDLGTGSGVLAIGAALCGARSVVAVDVDPDAIESARASHALNPQARGIEWLIDDFRDPGWAPAAGGRQWDLVMANLTGGMLRSSADRIRALVSPRGRLIVSGFDTDERPLVEHALALTVGHAYVEDNWVGLSLVPSP
jgi:ribosomal protein L11 methyltransferase